MCAKPSKIFFIALAILLLQVISSRAQSVLYSNAVTSLGAAGYWPMHEAGPLAPGDIETNYGSLGALGNAYFPDYQVNVGAFVHQVPGALANDTDSAIYFTDPINNGGTATNGMFVPHTSSLSTLKAPFTVECWFMATNLPVNTFQGDILSQADGSKTKGLRLYYQNNAIGAVVAIVYFGTASATLTFTASSASNQWHHLVLTCAANTNVSLYFDGVQGGVGGTTTAQAEVGKYTPEANQPLTIGQGLGNQRGWHGMVDEVAVYATNLTAADISQHYSDGIGGAAGQYVADVTNDHPAIYLRMDSPGYTAPATASWPVLSNDGQTNGVAVNNGLYTPGTIPGLLPGASNNFYPRGSAGTNVALLSGVSSFADAGYAPAYNPAGGAPFSVAATFRGNPTDTNRVQSIVGHGTNSWELGLAVGGAIVFNSGTNSTAVVATGTAIGDLVSTSTGNDDGNWHQVVAVHTGTTNVLYVDGVANNTNVLGAASNVGNLYDVMIGSDPCYTNTPVGLGRQLAGQVCEVAFFTNALSSAQVQMLFSNSAVLPVFSLQPASGAASAGTSFTFTASINGGSPPFAYQWYSNNVPVAGATSPTLTMNPLLPINSGNYYVVVTNIGGAVTSAVASLTVYTVPTLTGQFPVAHTNPITLYAGGNIGGTNYLGSSPTFSVLAVGAFPTAYQWLANGVGVNGATNASFTFTNCQLSSPTTFACVLTNIYGRATSMVWSVSYIPTTTAPFPQLVLADQPLCYWRLNEPDDGVFDGNDGAICNDYQSGNNGIYTNAILANALGGTTGYSPGTDPTEAAAEFGYFATTSCDANSIGTNIDFSGATNAAFTVAIWANGTGLATRNGNAGLVTKGFNSAEEFVMDEGGTGQALRFGVRVGTTGNTFYGATAFSLANDSRWHFVVGVCDEPHTNVAIYVDGNLYGTAIVPTNSGILQSSITTPIRIGDRGPAATPGSAQFKGLLNDAAVFNYAMTQAQIKALYQAAGIAASISQDVPSNTNVNSGGTLAVPAVVVGSSPLYYQWYTDANVPVAGQTNATLLINNFTGNTNYYLVVSNSFNSSGPVTSSTIYVQVQSGAPGLYGSDVVTPFYAVEGQTAANSSEIYGSAPITYHWQFWNGSGWVNLADNSRVSGSQTRYLSIARTFAADAGYYQLTAANSFGFYTSSVANLLIATEPVNFYTNGLYWKANGGANIANGVLTLTDPSVPISDTSFFFQYPQYIGAFTAAFTYQAGGNMAADGVTFCIQNDPRGASALGSGGGQLAVVGIIPSVELELDIFANPKGYAFQSNGVAGGYAAPGSVQIASGDPIDVVMTYLNGKLELSFKDENTSAAYSTTLNVGDLTSAVGGSTAYIGFTGSYGGSSSIQTISNFSFTGLATEGIQFNNPTNVQVSWPGGLVGYVLQQNSDLSSTNWSSVTNADNVIGGQHQVVTPKTGTNVFYRLQLQ